MTAGVARFHREGESLSGTRSHQLPYRALPQGGLFTFPTLPRTPYFRTANPPLFVPPALFYPAPAVRLAGLAADLEPDRITRHPIVDAILGARIEAVDQRSFPLCWSRPDRADFITLRESTQRPILPDGPFLLPTSTLPSSAEQRGSRSRFLSCGMPFRLNEVRTPCGLSWMNCSICPGASLGSGAPSWARRSDSGCPVDRVEHHAVCSSLWSACARRISRFPVEGTLRTSPTLL